MIPNKLFTIIICTYNSEKRIARTINHILAQNKFPELVDKFIIVNNNSSDNTQQVINSFGSVIKSIFEPKQGVSYARLAGAKEVKTPWLIYIDDDIELELRSSKFGHFSTLYLISDSVVAIIKYIFKKMMPNVTRKEIMILEIKKEKAIAYLNNLFHGKSLPGTVKSLFGQYDFSGRQGF